MQETNQQNNYIRELNQLLNVAEKQICLFKDLYTVLAPNSNNNTNLDSLVDTQVDFFVAITNTVKDGLVYLEDEPLTILSSGLNLEDLDKNFEDEH